MKTTKTFENEELRKRLYNRSSEIDGCLEISGHNVRGGYVHFRVGGKKLYAHRVSWEVHFGSIPEGLKILHICDNPRCIQPLHLRLGTQKDNVQDMLDKGRCFNQRKTCCPKCGKDFTHDNRGKRRCEPCYKQHRIEMMSLGLYKRNYARKNRCTKTVA